MVKNNKKPRLRFKGFTDEWEQRKLGEVAPLRGGYAFKSADYCDEGVPIIRISNILADGTIGTDFVYYKEQQFDNEYLLENGAVLLAMSGATTGKVSILNTQNKAKYYQNQRVGYFPKNKKIDYRYIATILRSQQFINQLTSVLVAGAQPNVSSKDIDNFEFMISREKEEQTKIGNFFYNLDNLIALHQRTCDKLLNVKKALLDKMFSKNQEKTPKIRFKGFFDAWEQRKLGEIVEFYSGLTYKPNDIVDDDKETLVLRSCNVQNGEIVENDNVYVTSGVVNSKNVSQGDIIVVVRNGSRDLIGKHAVIKRNMLKTVIGAFMTGISSKYPNFVNSLLSTNQFFIEIEKNLGATINQITTGNFAKMNFTIPIKFDEKIKIGKMFLNLDNLITLHQRKCEKLKNIKKALLDKMFV